jgi:hypothetical protein
MYDNGVVSFVDPSQPGSLQPWQFNSQLISSITGANYFIAPFWTDLYPISGVSSYVTDGDNTYQRYTWNSLSEYYSGGTRFSTFSLTIRPDGSIKSTYYGLNITQSNVSVGLVGDSSKQEEKESIYFSNAGTIVSDGTIEDWERVTSGFDPCSVDPLYSTTCLGYEQAYFDQQCSINPLYSSMCPGYQQAYFDQQCSINPLYSSMCPGYQQAYFDQQCSINPLYSTACPGYAQAYFDQQCGLNALYNTQCPGYAEAKTLQDLQQQLAAQNEPTVESATVSTGPSSSSTTVALADPTRTETVITTDVGGVELTTTGEISVPTGQTTATKEAIKESAKEETKKEEDKKEQAEKKRVDPRALAVARAAAREAEATALSTADAAVAFSQSDIATSSALGLGTGIAIGGFRPLGVGDGQEEEGKTAQGLSSNRDANINLQNNTAQQGQQQDVATKSGPAVRNGGRVEGMEGGPDPAQLANAPLDFNQYLNAQLKDAQFYQSKEIYKGQRNVDNQRLLRGLSGGSDRLHQQMIDQQYNITGQ